MDRMRLVRNSARALGGIAVLAGVVNLILAPIVGDSIVENLWGVEPLTYVGAVLLMVGLAVVTLTYLVLPAQAPNGDAGADNGASVERWSEITQQYFDLFDHDLGRPLRQILGKERESRAILQSSSVVVEPAVSELLDEIERQTPSFRLMLSNIRVLRQLGPSLSSPRRWFGESWTDTPRWEAALERRYRGGLSLPNSASSTRTARS